MAKVIFSKYAPDDPVYKEGWKIYVRAGTLGTKKPGAEVQAKDQAPQTPDKPGTHRRPKG